MCIRRHSLTFTCCLSFLLIVLLQYDNTVRSQGIKDVLDSYDAQFLSHFNLSLTVKCKCNIGADQDTSTFTLQMTGSDGNYALVINRNNLGASRYTSKASRLDYNNAGDLTVSNLKTRTILNNGTSWKIRSEYDNTILNNTGGTMLLSSSALAPRLEIFSTNHQDPANLFFRYVLTLGRGYSQLLDTITSSTVDSDGIATATGTGSLFSSDKGTWRMEIDTNHDYLVRSASFTLSGRLNPSFTCKSQNYNNADMPLFANGVLEFPLQNYYMLTTRIMGYAPTYDETLYNASLSGVTNYPPNTSIMDFSRVDADGMPFVVAPLPKDLSQEIIE